MAEFLDMGGYGLYVWGAYSVTVVVLLLNALQPLHRERQLRNELARRAQRNKT